MLDNKESYLKKILESKEAYRKKLRDLPVGEKMKILEQLNQRARDLKEVRDRDIAHKLPT